MSNTWYFTCSKEQKDWFRRVISTLDKDALAHWKPSACALRASVVARPAEKLCVLVTQTQEIDALNLAAACVDADGLHKVYVYQAYVSGSFRKRAQAAGVSKVLDANHAQKEVESYPSGRCVGEPHAREDDEKQNDITANEPPSSSTFGTPREPAMPQFHSPARVSTKEKAPLLLLASGRGGVGKSAIATTMAIAASSWGLNVALVDLDLAMGVLYSYFGLDGPVDLMSYVQIEQDAEANQHVGKALTKTLTLYGPCAKPEMSEAFVPHVGAFLQQLQEKHQLVILDAPAHMSDAVAQAAQMADRVGLVSDERAAALSSLSRIASLCTKLGVARTRMLKIMNRCDVKRRDEGFLTHALAGLETAKMLRVSEGDYDVEEFLNAGHAFDLVALEEPFSKSSACALATILQDLGKLPKHDEAEAALAYVGQKRSKFFAYLGKAS